MFSYDRYATFSTFSWKTVYKIIDLLTLHSLRTRAQSEHFEHSNRYRVNSILLWLWLPQQQKGLD